MNLKLNKWMRQDAINLGIYGATAAGKTRLLFALIEGWKREECVDWTESAESFYKEIEATIGANRSIATLTARRGIEVRLRKSGRRKAGSLVFRDLRGELLSRELDGLDDVASTDPSHGDSSDMLNQVQEQVQECDAFLFLFDPASSEAPERIDQHHAIELTRAEKFIDLVLDSRENRWLPIVFVQTHLDRWENDPSVREKGKAWFEKVQERLRDSYESRLQNHYPRKFADADATSMSLSSVRGLNDVEPAVERVTKLVAAGRKFQARDRQRSRRPLLAAIVVFVLMAVVGLWVIGGSPPQTAPPPGRPDSPEIVAKALDRFEGFLEGYSGDGTELSSADAPTIRKNLSRIFGNIKNTTTYSEKLRNRMRDLLEHAASLTARVAGNENRLLNDRLAVLEQALKGLPNASPTSETLAESQREYWKLSRRLAVERLAEELRIARNAASPPRSALDDVIERFDSLERTFKSSIVFGDKRKRQLIEDVRTAKTFCENRRNLGSYPITFKIISAYLNVSPGTFSEWRVLELKSGERQAVRIGLKPRKW